MYGISEGFYFYHMNQSADKRGRKYDHIFMTILRTLTVIPIVTLSYYLTENIVIPLFVLFYCIGIFPFLHDGFYFHTRNTIHNGTYINGWKHYQDGRAWIDFNYSQRTLLFIGGLSSGVLSVLLAKSLL